MSQTAIQSSTVLPGTLTTSADHKPASVRTDERAAPRGLRALIETVKPGITRMVAMTSGVGFLVTAFTRADALPLSAWAWKAIVCTAGTALSAAGANALNQAMEHPRDAKMDRTKGRPIPSGRVTARSVSAWGAALCVIGLAVLWFGSGAVPAGVSAACIASYLLVYTPLKPVTPFATFIGAIPGALPPLIGASAASGLMGWKSLQEPAGVALCIIMLVWQIPHFLAIAWMYRDDYAKGGYAVLPVIDPAGNTTAWTAALWAIVLVPAAILPYFTLGGAVGLPFAIVAGVSSIAFAACACVLTKHPTRANARRVFFASIMHLPVLLAALTCEAAARTLL